MNNNYLSIKELNKCPLKQFKIWFEDIKKSDISEKNAVVLATNSDGISYQRMVLFKKITSKGFIFFTNYGSIKAQNIFENPNVSLLFYWDKIYKQVTVQGTASKLSVQSSKEYFDSRIKESKIAAWASKQSQVLENRATLLQRVKYYENKFKNDILLPNFWGGYEIVANRFEFWQGAKHRLHDRFSYELKNNIWIISRLYP